MVTKNCIRCGITFGKKPNEGMPYWKTKKYCSSKCANKIGHPAWNRGMQGIHLSPKSEFPKGFLPPTHWKKGNIPWNKTYLRDLRKLIRESVKSVEWRKFIFNRDSFRCQICGGRGFLNVHHKSPFSVLLKEFLELNNQYSIIEDKEVLVTLSQNYKPFWNTSNGITLCRKCHFQELHPNRFILEKQFKPKAEGSHL